MVKKSKKLNLTINKDSNSSSNFVVDLRKKPEEIFEKPKPSMLSVIIFSLSQKKNNYKKSLKNQWINFKKLHTPKIKNLAILNLIIFIIQSIKLFFTKLYKISYTTGWFFLFSIRFVWFFTFSLLKFIITFGRIDKKKSAPNFHKELSNLFPKLSIKLLRPSILFAITLLMLIIPIKAFTYYSQLDLSIKKDNIINSSEQGLDNFLKAASSIMDMNFNEASHNFNKAGDDFFIAKRELDNINILLFSIASIVPNKKAQLAGQSRDILMAGQVAAEVGNNLSLAIDSLLRVNEMNLKASLQDFNKYAGLALNETKILNIKLEKIDYKNLPIEYQNKFSDLRDKTSFLESILNRFVDLTQILYELLGSTRDKRYLFIFQNNTEMRATGGFIGSFALIDFKNGKIKNLEVPTGGGYDTKGGLKKLIAAPKPLQIISPLWYFWDSNWWPDWPTSAEELMWFYEKSDGPTVDGVISFTPTVFEKILDVLGPIEMPYYNVTLTKENFWETVQKIVEKKPENDPKENNNPKKIIGDLMEKIINEIPEKLNHEILIKLLQIMEESLDEKHILAYFIKSEIQEKIKSMGWAGTIKETRRDYLAVINTNIAGGKTDKIIRETIDHKSTVLEDGSIINTVEIKREHPGERKDLFTGVRNVNWMRIYVPKGSELIQAKGFRRPDENYFKDPDEDWLKKEKLFNENNAYLHETSKTKIYEESGKTVFANWSMMDTGETAMIYLKYKLPFKIEFTKHDEKLSDKLKEYLEIEPKELVAYTLLAQKQSGSLGSAINSNLKLAGNFQPVWMYPENINVVQNGWEIKDKLNTDKHWAILITKNDKENSQKKSFYDLFKNAKVKTSGLKEDLNKVLKQYKK